MLDNDPDEVEPAKDSMPNGPKNLLRLVPKHVDERGGWGKQGNKISEQSQSCNDRMSHGKTTLTKNCKEIQFGNLVFLITLIL